MTRKLTQLVICAFEIGLILFVGAWTAWASPSGNGLICRCELCPPGHQTSTNTLIFRHWPQPSIGLLFSDDAVNYFGLEIKRDIVSVKKETVWSNMVYSTSPDKIIWGGKTRLSYKWVINRKTLLLSRFLENELVVRRICEAVSHREFSNRMEEIRAEYQTRLNKLLIGNKI